MIAQAAAPDSRRGRSNAQPWRFVAVTRRAAIDELAAAAVQRDEDERRHSARRGPAGEPSLRRRRDRAASDAR
jgi:nitroreductase